MERYYFCNMFIKNKKLIDTEHVEWHRVGSVEKNLEKYIQFTSNSVKISSMGYYLEHTGPMIINTNKFTISFAYKIHSGFFQRLNFDPIDIYSFGWNTGDIKILDYDEQGNIMIRILINNHDITIPINYTDYFDWNHLLLAYDNGKLQIYHNGIKKKEDIYDNITCKFDYIRLGNYKPQEFLHEGPIVEYNNIVLVNDCLYNEEFDWKENHLHLLFPEIVYNQEAISKSPETLKAAPYLFSSRDSYNDKLHEMEITRHKNYKPQKDLFYLKYKFDL